MRKTSATKWIAIVLLVVHLLSLTACGTKQPDPTETNVPTESELPTETETQTPEFADGISVFAAEGLAAVVREDTENSMIITSTNAPGDWWKVKVEWPLAVTAGKTYEATFSFNSDAAGIIKYSVNGATFLDNQDYNVTVGANTFKVRFTAGAENYSCLELGGLGNFVLTFTGISVQEVVVSG